MQRLNEIKADKHLEKKINFEGVIMSKREFLNTLKNRGYYPATAQVPAIEYNRIKYNRMSGSEQIEYEKRMQDKKTEYSVRNGSSSYVINKTEYDYLNTLP